jgi:hypothetical protein
LELGIQHLFNTPLYRSQSHVLQRYEKECMVPADTNHKLAMSMMGELLHFVPKAFGIKAFITRIAICVLEERVRVAMMSGSLFPYLNIY